MQKYFFFGKYFVTWENLSKMAIFSGNILWPGKMFKNGHFRGKFCDPGKCWPSFEKIDFRVKIWFSMWKWTFGSTVYFSLENSLRNFIPLGISFLRLYFEAKMNKHSQFWLKIDWIPLKNTIFDMKINF